MTASETARHDERRPRGRRSLAFDVLVAGAALVLEVGQVYAAPGTPSAHGVALTALSALVLVRRRASPVAVLAATLALAFAISLLGDAPNGISAMIALYTTAAMCERRVSVPGLVATVITAVVLTSTGPGSESSSPSLVASNALLAIGLWGLGAYVQTRRRYMRELQDRAARLEREREQLARIAVIEERTSIARELHDIVAHSVSVMLVGVRGARDVLHSSPAVADDTLARVEASGEQSLAELRRILALLREPEHAAESRPQPSLAEIDGLVAEHRAGGLPVELEIVGQARSLPGGVELSVYRIVQEALTNVRKHSDPDRVTVTLSFRDEGLDVEVADDGSSVSQDGASDGHGLVGMRERVALLGGELEAGPRIGRGFRVAAHLPLRGDA